MERNGGTVGAPKSGKRAPNKCSFCKDTKCGNIQSCSKLRAIGRRLKTGDYCRFLSAAFSISKAKHDAAKREALISTTKPLLETLPSNTKWLCVSGLHSLTDSTLPPAEENVGVHVSCYGDLGETLPPIGGDTGDFQDRMVVFSAVRDWISKNQRRLIVANEMAGW